jgi:hypothetical protein
MKCSTCHFNNRPGVSFCEQCGAPLIGEMDGANNLAPVRVHKKKKITRLGKTLIVLSAIILIFLCGLMVIGIIPSDNELTPVAMDTESSLVTLYGLPESGAALVVEPGGFSAMAQDEMGIDRMELYVDGELMAAQNFDSDTLPVVFSPQLEILPDGEHEIFIQATNANGQTTQSHVVPVISQNPSGQSGSLTIEANPSGLNAPQVLVAELNAQGDRIFVSWNLPEMPINCSRIYSRPPSFSGLILVGEVVGSQTQFDFPIDKTGTWEVYVAYCDANGREGSLASTSVTVPLPGEGATDVVSSQMIDQILLQINFSRENLDRIYAYVRVGGAENRYMRVPTQQGKFLLPNPDGGFAVTIPGNNLSISQPLQIEAEIWGLDAGFQYQNGSMTMLNPLIQISRFTTTIQPEDMRSGRVEFRNNDFWGFADLLLVKKYGSVATTSIGGPPQMTLPAPENLRMATSIADCQKSASALGPVRDKLYYACQSLVLAGSRQFMVWQWPPKRVNGLLATEEDLFGFELKLVLTDAAGLVVGESITAIPFPTARGELRLSQSVACGITQTWYLRAVGPGTISEWVYAGTLPAQDCAEPYPPYNGCGGQMDFVPSWNPFGDFVPDLIFESACNTHDQCYNRAWSGKSKVTCDNEFLADLLQICAENAYLIDPISCSSIASDYYEAVNLFGRFFYEGDIDVMDCLYAVEPSFCFYGTSPEALMNVWNGTKSVAIFTKEAIETGAEKTWDAAKSIGGALGNSAKKIFSW